MSTDNSKKFVTIFDNVPLALCEKFISACSRLSFDVFPVHTGNGIYKFVGEKKPKFTR
jgi:hypothetical protein